jgi:small glutamine-rich tetratricopeptide repeat-containing protein alpha
MGQSRRTTRSPWR